MNSDPFLRGVELVVKIDRLFFHGSQLRSENGGSQRGFKKLTDNAKLLAESCLGFSSGRHAHSCSLSHGEHFLFFFSFRSVSSRCCRLLLWNRQRNSCDTENANMTECLMARLAYDVQVLADWCWILVIHPQSFI
jgi:hypothetical protein